MATGIFKRGNVWWIRYTGLDGKQKKESSRSRKFKDAEVLLAQRKKTIGEGKEPEIKRIPKYTFQQIADKYLNWIKGRQNSAKTKGYIIGQLLSLYEDIPLRRFNTEIVDQLQTDLINKGYKPSSNNKVTNIIKHMFNKAVEWDMVEEEVLKSIRKVKPLKDDGKRLRYASKEECKVLLDSCDPHLKPIVLTAIHTGMRRGEILNLEWDKHIDLKHNFILLDKTKNGERREIPINATLKNMLQNLTRRLDVPYVFHDRTTGLPYKDIKHSFQAALRRAKIKDFHFHDLRHTFASHLVMAGIDLTTVKELLGHKDIKMTLRYAHLAPTHKVNAVDILDNTLNGISTAQKVHNFAVGS